MLQSVVYFPLNTSSVPTKQGLKAFSSRDLNMLIFCPYSICVSWHPKNGQKRAGVFRPNTEQKHPKHAQFGENKTSRHGHLKNVYFLLRSTTEATEGLDGRNR